jgi:hypothetical protein
MSISLRRWLLLVTALLGLFVGGWALAAPHYWYDSFPGAGRHWLPILGPYNEHLTRDVGSLYLALVALSAGAAARAADTYLVRLTGAAWLVFSIPHLLYHALHLDVYPPLDQALNVVGLGYFVLAGAAMLLPLRAEPSLAEGGRSSGPDEPAGR